MGLINALPVSKLQEIEREEGKKNAAMYVQDKPVIRGLAAHIRTLWDRAQRAKQPYEQIMLEAKRQRKGEYSQAHLAAIRQLYGADYKPVWMGISETKSRAAESWIKDIVFQPGTDPWDLAPTPIPQLPVEVEKKLEERMVMELIMMEMAFSSVTGQLPDFNGIVRRLDKTSPEMKKRLKKVIKEMAMEAAEEMKLRIKDQFHEGGWTQAMFKEIFDVVTYGTCIHKGPSVRKEISRSMGFNPDTGLYELKTGYDHVPMHFRVNPFNYYPSADNSNTDDGYCFEKMTLSRMQLSNLIGVRGYDSNAIRKVLEEHSAGGLVEWTSIESERLAVEGRTDTTRHGTDRIDVLEYWGSAPGRTLIEWGIERPKDIDPAKEYPVAGWQIGSYVIKAMLNPDPLGHTPYSKSCFIEDPDVFWGKGVPQLIKHLQSIVNAVARALVNNVGIASGPQVEVNIDRKAPGTSLTIYPWKVWEVNNQGIQEGRAINFYQPNMVTDKLIEVERWASALADEESGIPKYAHGETNVAGAGETASGLSMLMTSAARGVKNVIKNLDAGVITNSVEKQYYFNLREYQDNPEIIGDMKVVPKGSSSLIAKEQLSIRRKDFLINTNNPWDQMIIGNTGRAELLKESIKALEMDPEKILRDANEIESMVQGQMMPPPPGEQMLDAAGNPVAGTDFDLNQAQAGERNM